MRVDPDTVWNDLPQGVSLASVLHERMSWLHDQLHPQPPIEHDIVESSAGKSPVVRLFCAAMAPGYKVMVDIEEHLHVSKFPKSIDADSQPVLGPSAKVCLLQRGVSTSAGFDWDYLLAMWPLMKAARSDWVTRRAGVPTEHDRANHQAMVAKGGPPYLGIGYGDRQTRIRGECMFGARIQLRPDIRLRDLVVEAHALQPLILDMAREPQPVRNERL